MKYSVIGDNTQENREHVEMLGHSRRGSDKGNIIITFSDGGYMCAEFEGNFDKAFNDAVKCLHSDELFKAVSAMREDSDYMQWFTDGKEWYKHLSDNSCDFLLRMKRHGFYKATLTEIQERFKEKEK